MQNQQKRPSTFADPDNFAAVSVHQPYAGLIRLAGLHGFGKDVEIRPTRITVRGPLVICAARRLDQDAYLRAQRILVGGGIMRLPDFEAACGAALCGHAVALFELVGCRPMEQSDHERAFTSPAVVDAADHYAWIADAITALHPFPAVGKQGFFRLPKDVIVQAMSRWTTFEQRVEVRAKLRKQNKTPTCSCGAALPQHLVEFMNDDPRAKHVCSCSMTYIVTKKKFVAEERQEVDRGA